MTELNRVTDIPPLTQKVVQRTLNDCPAAGKSHFLLTAGLIGGEGGASTRFYPTP